MNNNPEFILRGIREQTKDYESLIEKQKLNLKLPMSKLSPSSIKNISKLTLTTSTMNRLPFLKESLTNWVKFPFKKIIVLDWGSTEETKAFIDSIKDPRIEYYRIEAETYHHSAARNIKMALVPDDGDNSENYVLSIDNDILLTPLFLDKVFLSKNTFHAIIKQYAIDGITGTSVQTKKNFFDIKGCDDRQHSWGFEDLWMFHRLEESGVRQIGLNPVSLHHQPHSDELRIQHTISKSKWESNFDNKSIVLQGEHVFNSVNYEIKYKDEIINSKDLLAAYE